MNQKHIPQKRKDVLVRYDQGMHSLLAGLGASFGFDIPDFDREKGGVLISIGEDHVSAIRQFPDYSVTEIGDSLKEKFDSSEEAVAYKEKHQLFGRAVEPIAGTSKWALNFPLQCHVEKTASDAIEASVSDLRVVLSGSFESGFNVAAVLPAAEAAEAVIRLKEDGKLAGVIEFGACNAELASNPHGKFVVTLGSLGSGFYAIGPFDDSSHAIQLAERIRRDTDEQWELRPVGNSLSAEREADNSPALV